MIMGQAEDNIADVRFILSKVEWFTNQPFAYLKEHKEEWLYCVPHPSEEGAPLTCGYEAHQRFYTLARRLLSSDAEKAARVHLPNYVKELKAEFVRRFLQESKPVDRSNVDRLLSSAYRRASRKFDSLVHYVPCTVFVDPNPNEFEVGPVHFMRKSRFEELHSGELETQKKILAASLLQDASQNPATGEASKDMISGTDCKESADLFVDELRDFFGHYDWIAEVTVAECDEHTSRSRALLVVEAALDVLKLFFGKAYADRLGTAYGPRLNAKSAELTRSSNGAWNMSVSTGYHGNIVGEKWLSIIYEQAGCCFHRAGQTLHCLVDPQERTHLRERFVDALTWYGDGVSELSPAAQVVKYVSAMERITGTGKEHDAEGNERGVTEIVTIRSTILYHHGCQKSYEECKAEVNAIYDCRSNLVHGSLSPFADSVANMAAKAEEVTRFVLLGGLDLFTAVGLSNAAFRVDDLRRSYLKFEKRFAPPPRKNAEQMGKSGGF
jgi:hypothetical protein